MVSQKLCIIFVHATLQHVCHMTDKFKPSNVHIVVDKIVVGVLTHCALLHSMCDLKAAQMSLISKFMLWLQMRS